VRACVYRVYWRKCAHTHIRKQRALKKALLAFKCEFDPRPGAPAWVFQTFEVLLPLAAPRPADDSVRAAWVVRLKRLRNHSAR
jgi:hypothetical protein